MTIEISKLAADAMVDGVELAIAIITDVYEHHDTHEYPASLADLRVCIETLQMIRVSYMLAARNAAKEQRKDRANTPCDCDTRVPGFGGKGTHFDDCTR
jgi:hypothetical protein